MTPRIDRRSLIGIGALALAAASARASADPLPGGPAETIEVWPDAPPGSPVLLPVPKILETSPQPDAFQNRILSGIARPELHVFRPASPNGSTVLILPGGGYRQLSIDLEGFDVARLLNTFGVTAFVLAYRLPHEGWQNGADVPLQDAQRAMRLLRANATRFSIEAKRLGVLGFSAGGHLAASLGARSGAQVYPRIDSADDESAAPDWTGLIYPVITMLPPFSHEASREMLLGEHPSTELQTAYSCERLVTAQSPPCFLAAASDDPDVAPDNSLIMLASLRAAHVPAELHLFQEGGHGFGLAADKPTGAWPELLLRWVGGLGA